MTELLWWQPHLEGWSRAVGISYTVCVYTPRDVKRRLGDWWRNGGTWCLHLDAQHYAQFMREDFPDEVRRSLTWSLQTLSLQTVSESTQGVGWRERLLRLLQQFCKPPSGDNRLTDASQPVSRLQDHSMQNHSMQDHHPNDNGLHVERWNQLENIAGEGTLNDIEGLPGYLVWLHFDTQGNTDGKPAEWQSAAEEVIEAVVPGGLLGWSNESHGNPSAFLLCPVDVLSDGTEDPIIGAATAREDGSDLGLTNLSEDERLLQEVVLQLLQNLEVDAYLLAEAAVSCRISGVHNVGAGIATLITAWRVRRWRPASDKVVMWTEQRVLSLLLAVPEPVIQLFLQTDHRQSLTPLDKNTNASPDVSGVEALPAELMTVLLGVIKANLNVSEAARLLYLHRNTLLHRIERIRQWTGYDIRNFEDALTLWLMQLLHR